MTLVEFLEARIAEDEAATRGRRRVDPRNPSPFRSVTYRDGRAIATSEFGEMEIDVTASHGTWLASLESVPDPRVLAECDAKRRIVELHKNAHTAGVLAIGEDVLQLLALPYADHPDYQQEWKP